MSFINNADYIAIIRKILAGSEENQVVEFKKNNSDPETIAENISALANSAALNDVPCAYVLWGIDDQTKTIIGTSFKPNITRHHNQLLEIWLKNFLSSNASFSFQEVKYQERDLVLLIIEKAHHEPVKFKHYAYIRIGSSTTQLSRHPIEEKNLFRCLEQTKRETFIVRRAFTDNEALEKIDISTYYDLIKKPIPGNRLDIINNLIDCKVLSKNIDDKYSITVLGALLFAKKLSEFDSVSRKAVRVVQYENNNRINILKNEVFDKGYALVFEDLIRYITALVPTEERITQAIRQSRIAYPLVAIREIIANALIHQELSVEGAGPLVEIFDNRIEVTNPGKSLVNILRIIDSPSLSRNEALARLMRQMGMCEELGTGWDRIVMNCELSQLPAPIISNVENFTKVILFQHIPFKSLTQEERLRAVYLHASLKYVNREYITNASLRERFGLEDKDNSVISRLIRDAVRNELIIAIDPDTSNKHMKYQPHWAREK